MLSNALSQKMLELREQFKNDNSEDCSCIAETLRDHANRGQFLIVKNKEYMRPFVVTEYGISKSYQYHVAYVLSGAVYDPRYTDHAISLEVYRQELTEANHGTELTFELVDTLPPRFF